MMKYMKTAPLLLLLVSTGILFTVIGIAGKDTIYAGQEYDPVKAPILSVMFTAVQEEIYPWQLLEGEPLPEERYEEEADTLEKTESNDVQQEEAAGREETNGQDGLINEVAGGQEPAEEDMGETIIAKDPGSTPTPLPTATPIAAAEPTADPQVFATPTPFGPIEPVRETTEEEYLNHISADIYGDAGVIRAATYEFVPVDMTWFDDALFIGDSRTVGLRDYTDLSEHADFYCETSLTIYKVLDKEFKGKGMIQQALAEKDYKKIYLMVGINELGTGTTETYLEKYTEVVNTLRELEPEAVIYLQGVMRVSEAKSSQDNIFNNQNINARNNAVATLADNLQIFYIDVNDVVSDEQGALSAEYTHDQIHLLGKYNELWKEFLMTKGVELPKAENE